MEKVMTMPTGETAELPPWEDPSGQGAPQDKVPQDKVLQDKAPQDKVLQDKVPQDKVLQDEMPQDKMLQEREAAGTVKGEGGSGGGRWVLPSLCSALELLLQVLRFFSRRRGR